MTGPIIITVRPSPRRAGSSVALFDAWLGKKHLCRSATPLLTAARVLLAEGTSPDTELAMRHEGSDMIALRATVGGAAALCAEEGDRLPSFRSFKLFNRRRDGRKPQGISE